MITWVHLVGLIVVVLVLAILVEVFFGSKRGPFNRSSGGGSSCSCTPVIFCDD